MLLDVVYQASVAIMTTAEKKTEKYFAFSSVDFAGDGVATPSRTGTCGLCRLVIIQLCLQARSVPLEPGEKV